MAKSLLRSGDMQTERIIAEYMDENFYPKQEIITQYERTNDIDSQMKGSDIILTMPSLGIDKAIVDEKAASHYINKNLPTFAFELSFLTITDERVNGWLIDGNKTTQYYMLMWITAKKIKIFQKVILQELNIYLLADAKSFSI